MSCTIEFTTSSTIFRTALLVSSPDITINVKLIKYIINKKQNLHAKL